jgi:hypothetical protein
VILLHFETCGLRIEYDLSHLMAYRSASMRSMAMLAS